jgi:ATP-binding cassette subfamily F protein uup
MTIGLDGSGRAEIVAGGYRELDAVWQARVKPARPDGRGRETARPAQAAPARARLSFRDSHDLERLPARIAGLEDSIRKAEAALADPDLYARDAARFDQLTKALSALRAELAAAENRWLEVAERAEALSSAA